MIGDILGRLLTGFAFVVWYFGGVWGLFATFGFLEERIGFFFSALALFILPISFPATALFAGFAEGNWSLAIIAFGSMILAILSGMIGGAFKDPAS